MGGNLLVPYGRSAVEWLNSNNLRIVVILSVLHIGLAYIHTWHSGRADSLS